MLEMFSFSLTHRPLGFIFHVHLVCDLCVNARMDSEAELQLMPIAQGVAPSDTTGSSSAVPSTADAV